MAANADRGPGRTAKQGGKEDGGEARGGLHGEGSAGGLAPSRPVPGGGAWAQAACGWGAARKEPPMGPSLQAAPHSYARLPARPLSCLALNFLASRMGREDSHPRTLAGQGLASLAAAFTQRRGE